MFSISATTKLVLSHNLYSKRYCITAAAVPEVALTQSSSGLRNSAEAMFR